MSKPKLGTLILAMKKDNASNPHGLVSKPSLLELLSNHSKSDDDESGSSQEGAEAAMRDLKAALDSGNWKKAVSALKDAMDLCPDCDDDEHGSDEDESVYDDSHHELPPLDDDE